MERLAEEKLSFVRLSLSHPTLPRGELRASLEALGFSYRELLRLDGIVLLANGPDEVAAALSRTAYSKEGGPLIYYGDPEGVASAVKEWARAHGLKEAKVEADVIKGLTGGINVKQVVDEVMRGLREAGSSPRLGSDLIVKLYLTEDIAVVGLVTARRDLGDLRLRSPPNKPYWRSGELNVPLSRTFVNLSRLRPGGTMLDPFCGTGTLPIEAAMIGAARALCMDIEPRSVAGSAANLRALNIVAGLVQDNSERLPLKDNSVDSIATDPPYGRSTVRSSNYYDLMELFLSEALRVLKPGGYLVYAGPLEQGPARLARSLGLTVIEVYDQYVHGGLVRQIVVAKKAQG